jgi:hypothetical protein
LTSLNMDGVNYFHGLVAECTRWLPHVSSGGRVVIRTEAAEAGPGGLTVPEWCAERGMLEEVIRGDGISVMRRT